jgi:hypothetical protein
LKDPLDLLDERSPGERGPRVLLSIKEPHERVLSNVREREAPAAIPEGPAVSGAFASIPIVPPEYDTAAADQFAGSPAFPFFPNGSRFFPGTTGGTSTSGAPPPGAPPPDAPPGALPPPETLTPPPDAPPPEGPPPGSPPIPPTMVLPEPAPWTTMIGLFGFGVAARRRVRKRDQTSVR